MSRTALITSKLVVWVACMAPLAWTLLRAFEVGTWSLGPNPVEEILHTMGKTSLNLLLITLAVTPLRQLSGLNVLIRFRRLLGLFSFFYLVLHFSAYALLDLRLAWSTIFADIAVRPYITIGMLALAAMIPLAVTSTRAMQRRLGRNWVKLHRLIYAIAILGVLHFQWQTKGDLEAEPWVYAGIVTVLLAYRLGRWLRRRALPSRLGAARERPS